MKKIVAYLLSLLLFSSFVGEARGGDVVDSLRNLLQQDIMDTERMKALNDLAWELKSTNPDTAITLSKQALQLAQKTPKLQGQKGQANAFRNLGAFNYLKGNYSKALENYHKALKLYQKLANSPDEAIAHSGKKGTAATLGNIGIVYEEQGDYPKALEYYFKVLTIMKELENKSGIAKTHGNIGGVYLRQDDYPKALEYYFKALEMDKELGNKKGIARHLGNIGNTYSDQAEQKTKLRPGGIGSDSLYPKALQYYSKYLKISKEIGAKRNQAIALANIGDLYLAVYKKDTTGQGVLLQEEGRQIPRHALLDSAIAAIQKSHTIKKQIGDKYGLTFSLFAIGRILEQKNRPAEALSYYKHTYTLSDSIGALTRQKEAALKLYQIYKKLRNPAKALHWHEKYTMYKDSVFNEQKQKELGRQEAQYEWQQKLLKKEKEQEKQKALAQERAQRQRIIIGSVSGGLLLVLIFAGFLYNRFRVTRQQKEVIEAQKEIVDQKNEEITSSITYAQRIQQAVLVPEKAIKQSLSESFALLKPQSIVSGDFYYFAEVRDHIIISAIDCTGHGVPGAFMSLIGNDLLNQIVHDQSITSPAEVLNELDNQLEQVLRQESDLKQELEMTDEDFVRDGMDLAFCVLHPAKNVKEGKVTLQYAGANNPLYVVSGSRLKVEGSKIKTFQPDNLQPSNLQLFELPPDKQPIGKQAEKKPFTDKTVQLNKGDTFYIFSDGYPDQFGGPKGKKFMYKRFRQLLLDIQEKRMDEQKKILDQTIEDWMAQNNEEQIDDICVMGVRVG